MERVKLYKSVFFFFIALSPSWFSMPLFIHHHSWFFLSSLFSSSSSFHYHPIACFLHSFHPPRLFSLSPSSIMSLLNNYLHYYPLPYLLPSPFFSFSITSPLSSPQHLGSQSFFLLPSTISFNSFIINLLPSLFNYLSPCFHSFPHCFLPSPFLFSLPTSILLFRDSFMHLHTLYSSTLVL